MFRFESPDYLMLLWLVPILIAVYIVSSRYRKRQINSLGDKKLISQLAPSIFSKARRLSHIVLLLAIMFLIVAYANPQWGNKKGKVTAQSSDVFIALDISQSMMAKDVSPNRLERSKRLAQNIISALRGNRIGLIYFAGNAYLQMPLSNDYAAAQMFIASANTNQAGTQGTAIGEAMDLALRAYEEGKTTQRAMIIITDGENHDDESISKARQAAENGMHIYSIGVGTQEGDFVPYISQGREQFKRDDSGQPVRSVLNTNMIEDIARAGKGESYLIGQGNEIITALKREIEFLEKEEVEQRAFTDYESYFQYFVFIALLCLLLEFFLRPTNELKLSE